MVKTAIITGAASGIGFELALLLAKDSYKLILIDIDKTRLEETKNYILKKYNSQITILVKDLSKVNIAQEILESINDLEIDVLINT